MSVGNMDSGEGGLSNVRTIPERRPVARAALDAWIAGGQGTQAGLIQSIRRQTDGGPMFVGLPPLPVLFGTRVPKRTGGPKKDGRTNHEQPVFAFGID
jgi:hypothetical protein